MKRREFMKVSLGALAGASLASCAKQSVTNAGAGARLPAAMPDSSPRRRELLDPDWRFKLADATEVQLAQAAAIENWAWRSGTAAEEPAMLNPDLDTTKGDWRPTRSGANAMTRNGFAWFHTTLPALPGSNRTLRFECVDDNGVIYLNGKKIFEHQGWASSFDVPLDSAWRSDGPNVLVVLVQNTGGNGGITKPVTLGILPAKARFDDPAFDDSSWRRLDLPHDYGVEGVYDEKADDGHGHLPVLPAWYRRRLAIPASDKGKRLWLYFEGVFRDATIYLNGRQIAFQSDGYDSFHVDITDHVNYGSTNLLAVHVDPRNFEGWWYEGGGIYRHVWLNVADPMHVVPWGVYVISDVKDVLANPSAALTIQTRITNAGAATGDVTLQTEILDPDGKVAASVRSSHAAPAGQEFEAEQKVNLPAARLWSLEQRNRYRAVSTILRGSNVVDRHEQRFGIRTIRFDADKGFFLNEKPVKIQGVCNHQDFIGVGIAIPDSLFYYRMNKLKEVGCNAIRCSHNPMTPAMYEACDELGLLVMDETRHPGSAVVTKAYVGQDYSDTQHIENWVRRDRNYPSVIMWSLSNEEWDVQSVAFGATMLAALMKAVHKHDSTRPISTAVNAGTGQGWIVGYGSVEDLLGVNYNYRDYDWLHQQYPKKPIFGSETASDVSCRGNYAKDDKLAHCSAYTTPEASWEPLGAREFVAGGFVWTGFDYRGEPTPYHWPEVNSNFGILDMCGFPKDNAMYYKAWWKQNEPMVHVYPHWNWPGSEGKNRPLRCHSNCEEVELIVNGTSQGRKPVRRFRGLQWENVVHQPGKVEARGYIGGKLAASTIVETTGAPASLRLSVDRTRLAADGQDTVAVAVAVVDAQGRVVPTASNMVHFSVEGNAINSGVGNGDPSCHEPNQAGSRSAFNGLCMVLVKATRRAGSIRLTAAADGLASASLTLTSVQTAT